MEKQKKGVCPKCQSVDVDFDEIGLAGEQVYYPATCKTCGCIWNEYYDLTFDCKDVLGGE